MPALRGYELRPGSNQVGKHLAVAGLHHRSVRHIDDQVGPFSAAAVRTRACLAVARPPPPCPPPPLCSAIPPPPPPFRPGDPPLSGPQQLVPRRPATAMGHHRC